MQNKKYKLYLASGIRLWTLHFKDEYTPFFNKKTSLFQPALIDKDYTGDHRFIPIRIATKDLGEIIKCDAILAYMKMYDTQGNGPAGTDSTWECGYAIGTEKPTIMLVEDMEHLDYYSVQWMVTFSIGAILTTNKEVAERARHEDKFTHTTILYCKTKNEFENKIIEYLDNYYKSIYTRVGIINYRVDDYLRQYAQEDRLRQLLTDPNSYSSEIEEYNRKLLSQLDKIYTKSQTFDTPTTSKAIARLEYQRALMVEHILKNDTPNLIPFLNCYISECTKRFENGRDLDAIVSMIHYWLSIPAEVVKGRKQGKKKTRPTILYELYDLVSHHIVASRRNFEEDFVYKLGAIIEIYNWLNTYAIDDVFDNSVTRAGEPTLHVKYGSRRNALLLGSIGHCLSLLLMYELTKSKKEVGYKLIEALNEVQKSMYLGQQVDIDLTFSNPRETKKFLSQHNLAQAVQRYFNRIYGICGAFYEGIGQLAMRSTEVGAQFYTPDEIEQACIQIAKFFGLVQMIRNDLGDLIFPANLSKLSKGLKDTSHNDIEEGKMTLPVIYALYNRSITKSDKNLIINSLGKRNLTNKEKLEISRIIWESGAIDYCLHFIEFYSNLVQTKYAKHIHETPTRLKWIISLMDVTPLINISFKSLALAQRWRKLESSPPGKSMLETVLKITNKEFFRIKFEK